MPDWSRRRALHALTSAATLALAGCGGQTSSESSYPSRGMRVTDYELRRVRDPQNRAVVQQRETEDEPTSEGNRLYDHVTSEDGLESYGFASDVDGAEALASFCRATDFDSDSLFLHQLSVGACYAVELVDVRRESDGIMADFCRSLRPADVACRADGEATVALAIRLPFSGEDFSSVGVGFGSDCPPWVEPGASAEATERGGSGE